MERYEMKKFNQIALTMIIITLILSGRGEKSTPIGKESTVSPTSTPDTTPNQTPALSATPPSTTPNDVYPIWRRSLMKVARIYLRVSTEEQDLNRQASIEHSTRAAGYYVQCWYLS